VGKGSRQNGSVTSGKGLALRVGPRGPHLLTRLAVDGGLRPDASRRLAVDRRPLGWAEGVWEGQGTRLLSGSFWVLGCFPGQSTTDLELVRTRGIRLFN